MVFDNRYFPLTQYPYITVQGRDSHATGDFFITTASRAADILERDIGIPELSGSFDQQQLADSMQIAGYPDLLPVDFANQSLPWTMGGKLQTQGFAFSYEQNFLPHLSFGVLGLAMRSNSTLEFSFDRNQDNAFTDEQIEMLDDIRRAMLVQLGLACNHVQQGGAGDTEVYLRWFDHWCYSFKLRSLYYGVRLGGLFPTGVKRNIDKPASVPFGGNGFWGAYISGDAEFEVKEDWKIGLLLRISKRFSQTRLERMPVARPPVADQKAPQNSEPQIFGVLEGSVKIDPGLSEIFYAYTEWEGIREGLGIRLQYTLVNHHRDHWTDERIDKTIPANLGPVEERSAWASEYVTLCGFYDFDKLSQCRGHKPIVRAAWDIPFSLLVGHRFVHSYRVSLGLEFNF